MVSMSILSFSIISIDYFVFLLLEQWFSSVNPSPPIWKFVFIYYCITLFTACVLFVTHFSLLRKETIRLLNSGIQVEQTVNLKGELARVWKILLGRILTVISMVMWHMFTRLLVIKSYNITWTKYTYICIAGQDSVNTFYLCFIAQCIIGVCILPIIGFAFGLIRPCMPPALSSLMDQ